MGQKNQMRNLTAQQAKSNAANSGSDRATMATATGKVQGVADQLLPTVSPNGALTYKTPSLSPYAAGTYAGSMNDIANTYAQQREMGMRALGQSGFGSSPGAISSMNSTLGRGQQVAGTNAYRNALQDSLNQMLTGAGLEQGISSQYGGQALNESGLSTSQASQRIQQGSTLGDIMSGVSQVAGLFSPMGGFGGIGQKSGLSSKPGFGQVNPYAPSGVGGYGGGRSSNGGFYS